MQNFSLETQNDQLTIILQKSFKTCLRKLIIIATFIPRNNLLFYFLKIKQKSNKQKKSRKKRKKAGQIFFLLQFLEIAPKKVPMGMPSTLSTPSKCFEEDETEEATEKKIKNLKNLKNKKKIRQNLFVLILRNCHQKGVQGDVVYSLSALKVFFKRIKQERPLKVHLPMLSGVSKPRSTQLPLEDWVFKSADF